MPTAPDYAPSLAASGRRRPPQRATPKNSRLGFFDNPSGRTLARRHSPHRTAPGYRACGYKTASGRPKWLSRDPLSEYAGINLYGYVTNDPVNLIDSLGLCNEWQASVGISGTLGWVLFGGGGANVGFTSTGHFFVQFQAYGGGAVGLFAGVGWAGGIAHSNIETPAGVSVTKADHYEGDVGLGPIAGGYSADIDKSSQGGGFPLPKRIKGGEGIGLLYGQGRSITTTVATGALWSGGCGH